MVRPSLFTLAALLVTCLASPVLAQPLGAAVPVVERNLMLSVVLVVVGLALLVGGADVLIRGVSAIAAALGVPPVVIGLTVVAFGTSMPELVVNSMAAWKHQTGLAFGNIVGSCAINVGWVLAVTAIIRPLRVEKSIISREIPMMLLATASVVVLSLDRGLGGGDPVNELDRGNGLMLLLLFGVFLYYTVRDVLGLSPREIVADPLIDELRDNVRPQAPPKGRMWVYALMTLAGIAAVAGGGRLTVAGAVSLAEAFDVPEVIIGLTIISFGTTLPELATGITAARRGESDIAIGNVVGSNIFNLLFIGGTVSTIHPMVVPDGGYVDLFVMAALNAVLLPVAIRGPLRVTRVEGAFLLFAYLTYAIWRTLTAA